MKVKKTKRAQVSLLTCMLDMMREREEKLAQRDIIITLGSYG